MNLSQRLMNLPQRLINEVPTLFNEILILINEILILFNEVKRLFNEVKRLILRSHALRGNAFLEALPPRKVMGGYNFYLANTNAVTSSNTFNACREPLIKRVAAIG
jgi:hypothetical protein